LSRDKADTYILDTSALLTFIEDENGSDIVNDLLFRAENGEIRIYLAFISITEVYYITLQEKGKVEALRRIGLIQSLAVQIEESSEVLNLRAGNLKANNRISLADAYIAAFCMLNDGILVYKDPEFEKLSPMVEEQRLPYKT